MARPHGTQRVVVRPGDRYGRWEVLSEVVPADCGARRVLARCDCGREFERFLLSLRAGTSPQCAVCASRRNPEAPAVGQRFHGWIVIGPEVRVRRLSLSSDSGFRTDRRIPVRCDCGLEQTVSLTLLRCGKSKRCLHCGIEQGHRTRAAQRVRENVA